MLPPPSSRSPRQRAPQRFQQQRVLVHRDAHAAAPALDAQDAPQLPPLRAKPIGPVVALRSPVRAHGRLAAAAALDEEAHRLGVSTSSIAVALDIGDRQAAGMRAGGVPLEVGELVLAVPHALSVAVIGRLIRERLANDPPADPALHARLTAAASLLV